nr:MAG: hypothetical protein DIU70_04690 [Bacillota bacterium]
MLHLRWLWVGVGLLVVAGVSLRLATVTQPLHDVNRPLTKSETAIDVGSQVQPEQVLALLQDGKTVFLDDLAALNRVLHQGSGSRRKQVEAGETSRPLYAVAQFDGVWTTSQLEGYQGGPDEALQVVLRARELLLQQPWPSPLPDDRKNPLHLVDEHLSIHCRDGEALVIAHRLYESKDKKLREMQARFIGLGGGCTSTDRLSLLHQTGQWNLSFGFEPDQGAPWYLIRHWPDQTSPGKEASWGGSRGWYTGPLSVTNMSYASRPEATFRVQGTGRSTRPSDIPTFSAQWTPSAGYQSTADPARFWVRLEREGGEKLVLSHWVHLEGPGSGHGD